MSASLNLSIRLQAIAQALEDTLNEAAGEPCAFVLVCQADGVAQPSLLERDRQQQLPGTN